MTADLTRPPLGAKIVPVLQKRPLTGHEDRRHVRVAWPRIAHEPCGSVWDLDSIQQLTVSIQPNQRALVAVHQSQHELGAMQARLALGRPRLEELDMVIHSMSFTLGDQALSVWTVVVIRGRERDDDRLIDSATHAEG